MLKKDVLFTNLEELSYFLNTLSDQVSDQAKASNSKGKLILKNALASLSDQASDQVVQIIENDLNDKVLAILNILAEPKKRAAILENLGLSNHTHNLATNLAKPNEIKENINCESITNRTTNLANDVATVGVEPNKIKKNYDLKEPTVGASNLAIEIIESNLNDKALAILKLLTEAKRRVEIFENIGLTNQSFNREKYLDSLLKLGWIEMTIPEKPTHQNQKYKLTKEGVLLHKLIN